MRLWYTRLAMIKGFLLKQIIKRKLGQLPPEMQDRLVAAIEKEPEFFEGIAKEIEQEVKRGKPQTAAAMMVMRKHQQKFRELLS